MNYIIDLKEILLQQKLFHTELIIGLSKSKVEKFLTNNNIEYKYNEVYKDLKVGWFHIPEEYGVEIFIELNKITLIKYAVSNKIIIGGKNKINKLGADNVIDLIRTLNLQWSFDNKNCDEKRITIICGKIDIEILYDCGRESQFINRIYLSKKKVSKE